MSDKFPDYHFPVLNITILAGLELTKAYVPHMSPYNTLHCKVASGHREFSDAPYVVWAVSIYQDVCLWFCVSGHLNRFGQMNLCQNLPSVSIS